MLNLPFGQIKLMLRIHNSNFPLLSFQSHYFCFLLISVLSAASKHTFLNRLFKRLLQHLLPGLLPPLKTLLFQELHYTLSLKFKAMHLCYLVELYLSTSYSHQMNQTFGGLWACGPYGCSVRCADSSLRFM